MRQLFIWNLVIWVFLISSCSQRKPNWLAEVDYTTSPDGNAIVYQKSLPLDTGVQTSVATWITTPKGIGGSGVFDIKSPNAVPIVLSWTNDSTVLIQYDSTAKVIRMDTETYFLGRKTKFKYQPKK